MAVELKVPELGESVFEVEIASWLKKVGDRVERDEPVLEIETEKATMEIASPVGGTLREVTKEEGDSARVGEVVGYVEEEEEEAARAEREERPDASSAVVHERGGTEAKGRRDSGPRARGRRKEAAGDARAPSRPKREPEPPPAEAPRGPEKEAPAAEPRREESVPLGPFRRRIAERLVQATRDMALLTTFNDADMSGVLELRKRFREPFREKHGVKLGIMSFFVKATIEALKLYPRLNAEIRGSDVIFKHYYDVGVAVSAPKGLVVPVLRDADGMSFSGIELAIDDFVARAGRNELEPDELRGGTFTISNGGVFGSLLSTPIINPPQSGVLGLHRIEERPVARDGAVVVRPMMYLALTYDHRIVDGREAVGFLRHVKDLIEAPARILLEV